MKRIVLTGPKSSGKTNIGHRLAELHNLPFYDLDEVLEQIGGAIRRGFQQSDFGVAEPGIQFRGESRALAVRDVASAPSDAHEAFSQHLAQARGVVSQR